MTGPDAWFAAAGAAAWGTCAYEDVRPHMDAPALARAEALCPAPAGIYVAAFPYFPGEAPGNLSLYARGEDYHAAVARRLDQVCAALRPAHPGRCFAPLVDNSPLPEQLCAALAGLGLRGRNTLTILPPWGTWLFLGAILTDLPLESAPVPAPACMDCGKCTAACPTGALGPNGLDPDRCLSALTQKKGALTAEEEARLRGHGLVWGCDACQRACPYNRDVPLSPLPEFRTNLIHTLGTTDVDHLTRRQFQDKYPLRAFTWRGPGVLLRNLRLKEREGRNGPSV